MVVARLTGEVDMTNAAYIGDELTKAVPNEALGLVIDLTGTRYLDSAAIELLFELARKLAPPAPAAAGSRCPGARRCAACSC